MVHLRRLGSDRLASDDDSPWRDRLSEWKGDRTARDRKGNNAGTVEATGAALVATAPIPAFRPYAPFKTRWNGARRLRSRSHGNRTKWCSRRHGGNEDEPDAH